MRISTKLLLASLVPVILALVAVGGITLAYAPVVKLQQRQSRVIQLRTDLSTLDDLARSFVLYHDNRSRDQFFVQADETLAEVTRAASGEPGGTRGIRDIGENVRVMRSLFSQMVQNREAAVRAPDPVLSEAEDRLSAQLFIRSSAANGIAAETVRGLSDDIVTTQRRVSLLITATTILAAAFLTVGLLVLRRSITGGLNALRRGTEAVGAGDLSYRGALERGDELGDLGRSFDTMTARLDDLTVSKGELESEVEERRRVEERLRESLGTTQVLLEAADSLSSSLTLEGVLRSLEGVLSRATRRQRVLVALYDADRDEGVPVTSEGPAPAGSRFAIGSLAPQVRQAIDERRAIVIDYAGPEVPESSRQQAKYMSYSLVLVVPLVRGDRVLGFISVDDPDGRRAFDEREIEIARGVASQAAVAIENAQLYAASRAELARTSVLRDVADASATLDIRALARRVLDTMGRLIGLRAGILYLLDRDAGVLRQLALYGYADDMQAVFQEVALDRRSISARAVLDDALSRYSFDALPEGTRERAEIAGETDAQWVVVPVHLSGAPIGNLTLVFDADRRVTAEDLGLFDSLSDQLGVALENARLHERTEEDLSRTQLLQDVAQAGASGLELEVLASRMLEAIERHLGLQAGDVRLLAGDGSTLRLLAEVEGPEGARRGTGAGPRAGSATMDARAVAEDAVITHEDEPPAAGERGGALAADVGSRWRHITVPLKYGAKVLGTISLAFEGRRAFTREECDLFAAIAGLVAQGIENARLYEAERGVADRLQGALLALPDEIPGIEFAHAYHSAAETARVGGDFYDLFPLDEHTIGITVGDVAGKGLDAAVLTSLTKNTIRAHAHERGKSPRRILELTNDVVFKSTPVESFVTVFFGVLDLRDGTLTYVNGGHTTTALVAANGRVRGLTPTGPLLGAFPDLPFDEATVHAGEGDMLFLYTDGLTEARRDGELFGEERVLDLLGGLAGRSPAGVVQGAIDEVLRFTGGTLNDDLALLAIKPLSDGER